MKAAEPTAESLRALLAVHGARYSRPMHAHDSEHKGVERENGRMY